MSTAKMDPPSARHVPTFTRTSDPSPEGGFTSAVPPKAGDPETVARFSEPVVSTSLRVEEARAGSEVGAVTPGKPVTPAQVPIGKVTDPLELGDALDDGAVFPVFVAPAGVLSCWVVAPDPWVALVEVAGLVVDDDADVAVDDEAEVVVVDTPGEGPLEPDGDSDVPDDKTLYTVSDAARTAQLGAPTIPLNAEEPVGIDPLFAVVLAGVEAAGV